MRGPAIFVIVVFVLLAAAVGGIAYIVSKAAPPPPPRITVAPIEVTPATVELGKVSQCGEPISVRSRLTNTAKVPLHLNQVIVACGCTVPDLRTPRRLEPGESVDFTVSLDPWAAAGPHAQQIDFIYAEAGRAPPFRIAYEVVSPIRTLPGAAHRVKDPSTVVKVTTDDGAPFTIQSVDPPVVEEWIRTPTSETHIGIDWASVDEIAPSRPDLFEYDEKGRWKRGRLSIATDRPGCPAIVLRLYNDEHLVVPTGPTPGPRIEEPAPAPTPAP